MKNPVNDDKWYQTYCKLKKSDRPMDWEIESYQESYDNGNLSWKMRLIRGFDLSRRYYVSWDGNRYLADNYTREHAMDMGDAYLGPFEGSEEVGFRICRSKL